MTVLVVRSQNTVQLLTHLKKRNPKALKIGTPLGENGRLKYFLPEVVSYGKRGIIQKGHFNYLGNFFNLLAKLKKRTEPFIGQGR